MNSKAIAAACIVVGAGVAAAAGVTAVKSSMEDGAKRALSAAAGEGMKSSFQSVSAAPLSGSVTVSGWTIKDKSGRQAYRVKRLEAELSGEMRKAFLPFVGGSKVVKDRNAFMDVFDHLDAYGVENFDTDLPVKAAAVHASRMQLKGSLVKAFLDGKKKQDAMDMAFGTAAGSISIEKVHAGGGEAGATLQELKIDGLKGASARRIALEGVEAADAGRRTFAMKSLSLEGFKLPEDSLRKAAKLADGSKEPAMDEIMAVLAGFRKQGPVFSKIAIEGVSASPDGIPEITLAKSEFLWRSLDPFAGESRVQGLKVPVAAIDGLKLRGIDAIEADSESQSAGSLGDSFPFGIGRLEESGAVEVKKLAGVRYKCAVEGLGGLTELSVSIEDRGLAAQAAALIGDELGDLQEAAMQLCAKDTPDDARSCAAIASFIERPGRITFTLREDAFGIDMQGVADRALGRFGTIFNVASVPGHATLAEQVAALPPAPAEPKKAPAEAGK